MEHICMLLAVGAGALTGLQNTRLPLHPKSLSQQLSAQHVRFIQLALWFCVKEQCPLSCAHLKPSAVCCGVKALLTACFRALHRCADCQRPCLSKCNGQLLLQSLSKSACQHAKRQSLVVCCMRRHTGQCWRHWTGGHGAFPASTAAALVSLCKQSFFLPSDVSACTTVIPKPGPFGSAMARAIRVLSDQHNACGDPAKTLLPNNSNSTLCREKSKH